MSIRFSPVIAAQERGTDGAFSVKAFDLAALGASGAHALKLSALLLGEVCAYGVSASVMRRPLE